MSYMCHQAFAWFPIVKFVVYQNITHMHVALSTWIHCANTNTSVITSPSLPMQMVGPSQFHQPEMRHCTFRSLMTVLTAVVKALTPDLSCRLLGKAAA